MKFTKKTFALLLSALMLLTLLPLTAMAATALTITKQPANTYVQKGKTAKVTVDAQGEGLRYQWYIKNAGATKYSKSSITKATYSVTMSDKVDGRYVYCIVSDATGNTAKTKTVVLRQAATITVQPQDVTVENGQTATVSFTAVGKGLTYTWYYKNKGASAFSKTTSFKGNTYSVEMSNARDGRQVYCVVTDAYGKTATTNTVTLGKKAPALTITAQPQNTYVREGETAKLSVAATGKGLTYQWYIKNAGATKYSKSSITKATYSVKMSDKVNGRYVYCIVTDAAGNSVKTKTVVLRRSITITAQPVSTTVAGGETATVTVAALGDGLTYQWYIKNAGRTGFSKSSITAPTYTVTMSDKANGRQIYCIIADNRGNSVKTVTVTLTQKIEPLVITTQPADMPATVGDTVAFGVGVSGGVGPYTYRWQFILDKQTDWTDLGPADSLCSGYDSDNLTLSVTADIFARNYRCRCVITDAAGNSIISDDCRLIPLLTVIGQPENAVGSVGDTVSLRVTVAGGIAPYYYAWQLTRDGMSGWFDCGPAYAGYNTDTLTFSVTADTFARNYRYRCIITDATGNMVISNPAQVEKPFVITQQPENFIGAEDDTATFSVAVSGGAAPYTYRWQVYSGEVGIWFNITETDDAWASGYDTPTLQILVGPEHFEITILYRCVITDANGKQLTTNEVQVDPIPPMAITTQPESITAAEGSQVTFTVSAAGGKAPYTYQWQRSDRFSSWADINNEWLDGTKATLTISVTTNEYDSQAKYRCIITDAYGNSVTSDAAGVIEPVPLHISSQPERAYAAIGETATFCVTVGGGIAPYSYRWEVRNDSTYTWSAITQEDAAWASGYQTASLLVLIDPAYFETTRYYRCVITDAAGEEIVTDTVYAENGTLRIPTQLENIPANTGDDVCFSIWVNGGKAPYTYQWQRSSCYSAWANINDTWAVSTNSTLAFTVQANEFADQAKYRCIVTDADGKQIISNEVCVEPYTPMTITQQPQDAVAEDGGEAFFSVTVSGGVGPYEYEWTVYRDGEVLTYLYSNVSGCSVTVQREYYAQEISVQCTIYDASGRSISSDVAYVLAPFAISWQTGSVTVASDKPAYLGALATGGKGEHTYRWQFFNVYDTDQWEDVADYSSPLLQFQGPDLFVSSEWTGRYESRFRCFITDESGREIVSEEMQIFPPPLTVSSQPEDMTATIGDNIAFSATISGGRPPYSYSWQYSYDGAVEWFNVADMGASWKGYDTETLSHTVTTEDLTLCPRFRCVITDAGGNQITSDEGCFIPALTIIDQPQTATADIGDTVSFSVSVLGGKAPYHYKWMYQYEDAWSSIQQVEIGEFYTDYSGQRTAKLSFSATCNSFDLYKYFCIITDANGNSVRSELVQPVDKNPLVITMQPQDAVIGDDGTVTFSLSVSGGEGPYVCSVYRKHKSQTSWEPFMYHPDATVPFTLQTTAGMMYYCLVADTTGRMEASNEVQIISQ